MTLGEWIPIYLEAYKRDTIRPDSFYTIQLAHCKRAAPYDYGAARFALSDCQSESGRHRR